MEQKKAWQQRLEKYMDQIIASELEQVRFELVNAMTDPELSLLDYTERVIAFWQKQLMVDRIFICDMKDGEIVAGWKKGKNIVKLSDWDPHYVPLEDDRTLQEALEGDELVASPVDGEGADLAFTVRFGGTTIWLVALDQTDTARYFTHLDMALVRFGRDLLTIKARL